MGKSRNCPCKNNDSRETVYKIHVINVGNWSDRYVLNEEVSTGGSKVEVKYSNRISSVLFLT